MHIQEQQLKILDINWLCQFYNIFIKNAILLDTFNYI